MVVLFTLYPDLMKLEVLLEDLEVQSQSTCALLTPSFVVFASRFFIKKILVT